MHIQIVINILDVLLINNCVLFVFFLIIFYGQTNQLPESKANRLSNIKHKKKQHLFYKTIDKNNQHVSTSVFLITSSFIVDSLFSVLKINTSVFFANLLPSCKQNKKIKIQ